jgi:hypothetical protein
MPCRIRWRRHTYARFDYAYFAGSGVTLLVKLRIFQSSPSRITDQYPLMSLGPQSLPLIVELHDPLAHINLPSALMWGECSSGVAMLLLNGTFWNLSAQSFSIASRPKVGPSCSTQTASSVKFAATADASFLSSASICFFMAATSFSRSCGSGASFLLSKGRQSKAECQSYKGE